MPNAYYEDNSDDDYDDEYGDLLNNILYDDSNVTVMARKTAFTHSLTSQNNIHLAMQSRSSISTYKSEGVSRIVDFLKSPRLVSTPPLLSSLLGLLAAPPQAFVEQALSHTLLEEIKVIRSINHL